VRHIQLQVRCTALCATIVVALSSRALAVPPTFAHVESWLNANVVRLNVSGITFDAEHPNRKARWHLTDAKFNQCLVVMRGLDDIQLIGKRWQHPVAYQFRIPARAFQIGHVEANTFAPARLWYYVDGSYRRSGGTGWSPLSRFNIFFANTDTANHVMGYLDLWAGYCRRSNAPSVPS
jgi:hypothetical protein